MCYPPKGFKRVSRCFWSRGIKKIGGFGKYLGLPEHVGRRRKEVFHYLCQRAKNKINAWSNQFLSQAGKEVLIKSVITALPTYTMSCFMLPKGLLNEITSSMRRFWWSSGKDGQKIPWIAWSKITVPKSDGGIGIKDLEDFNIALLAKQAWRLLSDPSSLFARIFKAKYYRKTSFLSAKCYTTSSYAWRSIMKAQDLIKKGTKWAVGNGQQINVWEDNWLPTSPPRPPRGIGMHTEPNMLVKDLLIPGNYDWNISRLREVIHPMDVDIVKQIKPSVTGGKDILIWSYAKNGRYSVKTGYKALRDIMQSHDSTERRANGISLDIKEVSKRIWNFNIPPKIKLFWWRVVHNGIPVATNLIKRNIKMDNRCQLCGDQDEIINHMLFQCRVAREIWELAPKISLTQEDTDGKTLIQNLKYMINQAKKLDDLYLFIGWRIWKMRNDMIFNNKRVHIIHVIHMALMDQMRWREAQQNKKEDAQHVTPKSIRQVMDLQHLKNGQLQSNNAMKYYCEVDASWIASDQRAGLGWSLYRREGIRLLQGSATISPTPSAFHAEAAALLQAVQSLHALGFTNITFLGDNSELYDALLNGSNASIAILVNDIRMLAKCNDFHFIWVSRDVVSYADGLARQARLQGKSYTISWML